ncbi:MAG TPA: hypothetical protein VIR60_04045 [Gammaproteobacteria bacterium]
MKQRNPVRFVALRGPVVQSQQGVPRASFDDSSIPTTPNDTGLIAAIRRLIDQGEPVDEARRRSAAQFMASDNYVFRNPLWKPFLGLQSTIQVLIAEIRRSGQDSEFKQRLDERLKQLLGPTFGLDVFLKSPDFTSMRASLWQSYFANLIMETLRPFDRPALVFWIRLFHILDRIKNNEAVAELIDRFADIHPVIPLLVAGQTAKRAPLADTGEMTIAATAAGNTAIAANARQTIDKLRAINARLNRRLGEKIALPAQTESAIAAEAEAGTPSRYGRENDPWRFSRGDLASEDQQLLMEHGVIVEGQALQSITARIDERISREFDRLRTASTQTLIVNIGGVFVMRKRRGPLAGAPADSYQWPTP